MNVDYAANISVVSSLSSGHVKCGVTHPNGHVEVNFKSYVPRPLQNEENWGINLLRFRVTVEPNGADMKFKKLL